MPRRYKLGPEGEMRRAWGGKLPEEFDQREMLAFMAETDLQLQGAVSAETLSAIHAAGYDYKGGAVIPRPGKEDLSMTNTQTAVHTAEELAAAQEEMRRLIFEAPSRSWHKARASAWTRPWPSGWSRTSPPPLSPSRCRCGPSSPRAS